LLLRRITADPWIAMLDRSVGLTISRGAHGTAVSAEAAASPRCRRLEVMDL